MSVRFKGVAIFMNGQSYVIPALSLKEFEENYEVLTEPIEEVTGAGLFAQFKKYVPIIGIAIRRNYPEITNDELFDWLDLNTFRTTFLAVQAASGLEVVAPGE